MMIIQPDDKVITFRNQAYVVAIRYNAEFESIDLRCGPVSATNPNEFDPVVSWGFDGDTNKTVDQWLEDNAFLSILNTQFQNKFGQFEGEEPVEFWRQLGRFLKQNLVFSSSKGFYIG